MCERDGYNHFLDRLNTVIMVVCLRDTLEIPLGFSETCWPEWKPSDHTLLRPQMVIKAEKENYICWWVLLNHKNGRVGGGRFKVFTFLSKGERSPDRSQFVHGAMCCGFGIGRARNHWRHELCPYWIPEPKKNKQTLLVSEQHPVREMWSGAQKKGAWWDQG